MASPTREFPCPVALLGDLRNLKRSAAAKAVFHHKLYLITAGILCRLLEIKAECGQPYVESWYFVFRCGTLRENAVVFNSIRIVYLVQTTTRRAYACSSVRYLLYCRVNLFKPVVIIFLSTRNIKILYAEFLRIGRDNIRVVLVG